MGLGCGKMREEDEMMENILGLLHAYYTLANSWLLLVDGIQVWLRKRNNDIVIAVAVLS